MSKVIIDQFCTNSASNNIIKVTFSKDKVQDCKPMVDLSHIQTGSLPSAPGSKTFTSVYALQKG